MFSFKNKLDMHLSKSMQNKEFKKYRVLICCKTLHENIEKKILSYKGTIFRSIPSLHCICASLSSNAIEKIIEFPQVTFVTFDSFAILCGNSVSAANGILRQERYKLTGKGIGIGLIDSGVYPHPDLLFPNNKIRAFLDLIQGLKYPYDDHGHGTFISGLICGSGQCSKGLYHGIAESSHIYAIKAFNQMGKGYISDILLGIETLIAASEEFNIKVLCLPFELVEHNTLILSLFSKLFSYAVEKGMVVVVPSGHNGNEECSIKGIATLDNCITVGGLNTMQNPIRAFRYSSSGPLGKLEKPDLAAAAVDLCSLNTNKNYVSERNGRKLYTEPLEVPYVYYSGTSCACAFITSLCAILYENNPNLNHKDMLSLLKVSCTLQEIPKWIQGSGVIDINKILP